MGLDETTGVQRGEINEARQSEEMEQAKRGPARRRVQSIQCPRSRQDQQCRRPNEDRDLTLEPTSQVISDFSENHLVEPGTRVC